MNGIILNMKYIEELNNGDCFLYNGQIFLLTSDFKKNGHKLAYCLSSGLPQWFSGNDMITLNPVYTTDEENNIVPIKETPKESTP